MLSRELGSPEKGRGKEIVRYWVKWVIYFCEFYVFLGIIGLYMPKIGNKRALQVRFSQFYGHCLNVLIRPPRWNPPALKSGGGRKNFENEGGLTPSSEHRMGIRWKNWYLGEYTWWSWEFVDPPTNTMKFHLKPTQVDIFFTFNTFMA